MSPGVFSVQRNPNVHSPIISASENEYQTYIFRVGRDVESTASGDDIVLVEYVTIKCKVSQRYQDSVQEMTICHTG